MKGRFWYIPLLILTIIPIALAQTTITDSQIGIGTGTPLTELHVIGDVNVTGLIHLSDSGQGAPSLTFDTDQDTGIYKTVADRLQFTTGGSGRGYFGGTGLTIVTIGTPTNPSIRWDSDTNTGIFLGGTDTLSFATEGFETLRLVDNQTKNRNGSESLPSISFIEDSDTGFYNKAGNTLSLTTNGGERFQFTDRLRAVGAGLGTSPTYAFLSDTDVGMWNPSSNVLSLTAGGTSMLNVTSTGSILGGTTTFSELNVSRNISLANGTAPFPSLRFDEDQDTGIYYTRVAINFATGGIQRAAITSEGVRTLSGAANSPGFLFLSDPDTGIWNPAANKLGFSTGGSQRVQFNNSEARVLTNFSVDTNVLYVNASSDRVGIGTNNPGRVFGVVGEASITKSGGTGGDSILEIIAGATSGASRLRFGDTDLDVGEIVYHHDTNSMNFTVNAGKNRMVIDSSGRVGIATSSPENLLHISSTTDPVLRIASETATNTVDPIIIFEIQGGDKGVIGADHSIAGDPIRIRAGSGVISDQQGLTVEDGGFVGIGSNNPAALLHLEAGNPQMRFADTNDDDFILSANGGVFEFLSGGQRNILTLMSENHAKPGFVGIGTASPQSQVEIWHDTAAVLSIHSNRETDGDVATLLFSAVGSTTRRKGAIIFQSDDASNGRGDLIFSLNDVAGLGDATAATAIMTLLHEGQVGIGTTNPLAALDVVGTIKITDGDSVHPQITFEDSNSATLYRNITDGGAFMQFINGENGGGFNFMMAAGGTDYFKVTSGSDNILYVKDNPNRVGIGTSDPQNELHVIGQVNVSENLTIANGSTAHPSIRFDTDQDTGIFHSGSGNIDFSSNNFRAMVVSSGRVRGPDGTEALPAWAFLNDGDNGMYRPGTNQLGFSTGGSARIIINNTHTNITNNFSIDAPAITQNITPSLNNTYSLGTPAFVWKDVHVGPGSIHLGNITMTNMAGELRINSHINATGNASFNDLNVRSGSSIKIGDLPNFITKLGAREIVFLGRTRKFFDIDTTTNVAENRNGTTFLLVQNTNDSARALTTNVVANNFFNTISLFKFSSKWPTLNETGLLTNEGGDLIIANVFEATKQGGNDYGNKVNKIRIGFHSDIPADSSIDITGIPNLVDVITIDDNVTDTPFMTTFFYDVNLTNSSNLKVEGNLSVDSNINLKNGNITNILKTVYNVTGCTDDYEGTFCYDADFDTMRFVTTSGQVLQMNQETTMPGKNIEGSTVSDGSIVYTNGSVGINPTFKLAKADNLNTSGLMGVVTKECINNQVCPVVFFGIINNMDTSSFSEGDHLYLSDAEAGNLTTTPPNFPSNPIWVATAIRIHATEGSIFVFPRLDSANGITMNTLGLVGDFIQTDYKIRSLEGNAQINQNVFCIEMNGTTGQDICHLVLQPGGVSQASIWVRSGIVAPEAPNCLNNTNRTDPNCYASEGGFTWNVDFNTSIANGSDWGVTGDLDVIKNSYVGGNITLGQKITFALSETIDNIVDGWIRLTGNVKVTENLNVSGNISGNHFSGEMWFDSDVSVTTSIASSDEWTNVTGFNQTDNIGFTRNGDALIANVAGKYYSSYSVSFTGNPNTEFNFALAINGDFQQNTKSHRKVGAASDVGNSNGKGKISVNAGDAITLQVLNLDNSNNVDIHHASLVLPIRVGD